MTKKDFESLANALKAVTPLAGDGAVAMRTWYKCVYATASVCATSNARFDKDRFLQACGAVL